MNDMLFLHWIWQWMNNEFDNCTEFNNGWLNEWMDCLQVSTERFYLNIFIINLFPICFVCSFDVAETIILQ